MKADNIKALLEKYYAGESSLKEEEQLRNAMKPMDQLPEDLKVDAELFVMMNALASDSSEREINLETEPEKIIPITSKSHEFNLSWTMKIAAGIAILVFGTFAGWIVGSHGRANSEMAEVKNELNEMKQLVALAQLSKESASERIMATYEFKKLDSASDEILDALIYTFNNDNNTNVKNAAAEALFKFGNHDKVRKAFINGLNTQTDPLLQIKLIDMLVGLDEKRALPKLQEMMHREAQMKVVKQKAAQGIGLLL